MTWSFYFRQSARIRGHVSAGDTVCTFGSCMLSNHDCSFCLYDFFLLSISNFNQADTSTVLGVLNVETEIQIWLKQKQTIWTG